MDKIALEAVERIQLIEAPGKPGRVMVCPQVEQVIVQADSYYVGNGAQSDQIQLISPGSFSSGRLLAYIGGNLVYYDASNPVHLYSLVGMSTVAANVGEPLTIAKSGLITISGWGLTPDAPYFAGQAGNIHTAQPIGTLFSQIVGRAKDANTLIFSPQTIYRNA